MYQPPSFPPALAICHLFAQLTPGTSFPFQLLSPITDRIRFGDDIFILRGESYFTGCLWVYTTFIGLDIGLGMLGGRRLRSIKGLR
jgi:hypothetical protein